MEGSNAPTCKPLQPVRGFSDTKNGVAGLTLSSTSPDEDRLDAIRVGNIAYFRVSSMVRPSRQAAYGSTTWARGDLAAELEPLPIALEVLPVSVGNFTPRTLEMIRKDGVEVKEGQRYENGDTEYTAPFGPTLMIAHEDGTLAGLVLQEPVSRVDLYLVLQFSDVDQPITVDVPAGDEVVPLLDVDDLEPVGLVPGLDDTDCF